MGTAFLSNESGLKSNLNSVCTEKLFRIEIKMRLISQESILAYCLIRKFVNKTSIQRKTFKFCLKLCFNPVFQVE